MKGWIINVELEFDVDDDGDAVDVVHEILRRGSQSERLAGYTLEMESLREEG